MDPFQGLASFLLGKMKQSMMAQWLKLLFCLAFSMLCTFLFICGSVMLATKSVIAGVGTGMVSAAVCAVVLFRRSPLTKGLMVVLPSAEAITEMQTNIQVIERK